MVSAIRVKSPFSQSALFGFASAVVIGPIYSFPRVQGVLRFSVSLMAIHRLRPLVTGGAQVFTLWTAIINCETRIELERSTDP